MSCRATTDIDESFSFLSSDMYVAFFFSSSLLLSSLDARTLNVNISLSLNRVPIIAVLHSFSSFFLARLLRALM